MSPPVGVRRWWDGHVVAAVRLAADSGALNHAVESFWSVIHEAYSVIGDWPDPRRCRAGAAGVLRGAADGVLGATLDGPVAVERLVGPWPAGAVSALVHSGLSRGWLVGDSVRVAASSELSALAAVGTVADPAAFLARRARFELDWFWRPVAELGRAARTGRAPACFGAPGRAGRFRRAAAEVNLAAFGVRAAAARRVASHLGAGDRAVRILELGTGTAVWGAALASHPGSTVVTVDYPEVHDAVAGSHDRIEWVGHDPVTCVPDQGAYDLAVVPDVLHTVPAGAVSGWLAGLAAALRPGGTVVFADMFLDATRRRPAEHLLKQAKLAVSGGGRVWDVGAFCRQLRAVGLRPQQARLITGLQIVTASRG